jgi:hypothetical protein
MSKLCQPYTCLFDISRENVDGRSFDTYKNWLKNTINILPGIIVFCEKMDEDLKKLNANFVLVNHNKLETFNCLSKVKEVLSKFNPDSPQDLTFRLPEYALIQFSKFELAAQAYDISKAHSLLWVDAGLSRFISSTNTYMLESNAKFLLRNNYSFSFELDLKNNFDLHRLKISKANIGSSRRIISGTSFWLRSEMINPLNFSINQLMRSWIEQEQWDNEQVALRNLFEKVEYLKDTYFVLQNTKLTGSVARNILNSNLSKNRVLNRLIYRLLR